LLIGLGQFFGRFEVGAKISAIKKVPKTGALGVSPDVEHAPVSVFEKGQNKTDGAIDYGFDGSRKTAKNQAAYDRYQIVFGQKRGEVGAAIFNYAAARGFYPAAKTALAEVYLGQGRKNRKANLGIGQAV
jgi:hypothetical protein